VAAKLAGEARHGSENAAGDDVALNFGEPQVVENDVDRLTEWAQGDDFPQEVNEIPARVASRGLSGNPAPVSSAA
jgi:hypothetical protein